MAVVDPQTMINALQSALSENAGVVSVNVDGTSVRYDRKQALRELDYWQRQKAQSAGKRPRVSSVNLRNF
jgi:hypothetical protein